MAGAVGCPCGEIDDGGVEGEKRPGRLGFKRLSVYEDCNSIRGSGFRRLDVDADGRGGGGAGRPLSTRSVRFGKWCPISLNFESLQV